jgi:hypothetical protein
MQRKASGLHRADLSYQPCAMCSDRQAVIFCVADSCALCDACDRQLHNQAFFDNHVRIPLSGAATPEEQCAVSVNFLSFFLSRRSPLDDVS